MSFISLSHCVPLTGSLCPSRPSHCLTSLCPSHLSLALVVMMKPKELKTKIYSQAHSLILSLCLTVSISLSHCVCDRYVEGHRPALFKGVDAKSVAAQKWTEEYVDKNFG